MIGIRFREVIPGRVKGVAGVICVLLAACVSGGSPSEADGINETMQSWMGHSVSDLIASWGPPDQETSVEQGARVLTYNRTLWMEGDPLSCDDLYPTHDPRRAEIDCIKRRQHQRAVKGAQMFWADAGGKLYRWSWKVTS
jgi:hypothetical protein